MKIAMRKSGFVILDKTSCLTWNFTNNVYERAIDKSTCLATSLRNGLEASDAERFFLPSTNLPRNKIICCKLEKTVAESR